MQLDMFADPVPERRLEVVGNATDRDGLRYYQRRCVDNAVGILADTGDPFDPGTRSCLVVMATGLGKTQVFSAIAKHWPGRVLVLAHRSELIDQARKRLEQMTGEPVAVEQAGFRAGRERLVVATVQTLFKQKRLDRFHQGHFSLIVIDECFPAGTMVGGKPIENIRPGDVVPSVDHATGKLVRRRVTGGSRKTTHQRLVVIHHGATTMKCTANHPVFVRGRGYVAAKSIKAGDVLCVLGAIRGDGVHVPEVPKGMLGCVQESDLVCDDGIHEQAAREREDAGAQSDAPRRIQGAHVENAPLDGTRAECAGWEWLRAVSGGEAVVGGDGAGLVAASCRADGDASWVWVPDLLQARPGARADDDRRGGGRREPCITGQACAGPEEDAVLEWSRVGRVEVLEPAGPEGTVVYDLEVEGSHTFFADGALVHNCHHAIAKTYRSITEHFGAARILGVTATPDRTDEKALGKVFEAVAYKMDISEGIEAGYLVPLRAQELAIQGLDLGKIKARAGDLAEGELDDEIARHAVGVTKSVFELTPTQSTVVFTPGVKSAHMFAECLNALEPDCAAAVDGETDPDTRKRIFRDFSSGRLRYLCNCMVATEGFDAPRAEVVVMARPTKSRSLYAQCVGRVTRVLPGTVDHLEGEENAEARRAAIAASVKPAALILDVTGHAGRHTLVCPLDLLGGDFTDDEKKLAKKKLDKEPGGDIKEKLIQARQELINKAAVKEARVKSEVREFNPFTVSGVLGLDTNALNVPFNNRDATQGQLQALRKYGMSERELKDFTTFRSASRALESLSKRREQGLATLRQLAVLRRFGVADANITFRNASEAIDYTKQCQARRSRVDAATLEHIAMRGR